MNVCCDNTKRYKITFNIGNAEKSVWLICEKHSNEEPLFQTHIISKKELN